jgi:hypothetical protein
VSIAHTSSDSAELHEFNPMVSPHREGPHQRPAPVLPMVSQRGSAKSFPFVLTRGTVVISS